MFENGIYSHVKENMMLGDEFSLLITYIINHFSSLFVWSIRAAFPRRIRIQHQTDQWRE